MFISEYSSPIGQIILRADNAALTGLWFEGQKHFPVLDNEIKNSEHGVLLLAKRVLDEYFFKGNISTYIPLSFSGTDFQKRVWQSLSHIPFGTVVSYSDVAKKVGCSSVRAVANAVSRNPISIIIPCHRVVGKNGTLTGYAGGLDKKVWLLMHEGVDIK